MGNKIIHIDKNLLYDYVKSSLDKGCIIHELDQYIKLMYIQVARLMISLKIYDDDFLYHIEPNINTSIYKYWNKVDFKKNVYSFFLTIIKNDLLVELKKGSSDLDFIYNNWKRDKRNDKLDGLLECEPMIITY